MRKLILVAILAIFSFGNDLVLQEGQIVAHTEIFGDSEINQKTTSIESELAMGEDIESIKGNISILSVSLKSENKDRDVHMYEVLNKETHPTISFQIKSIIKIKNHYKINGILNLNNVKKEITSIVTIIETEESLNFIGSFSIKLTQFDMKPPSMFFLSVRDQIDIKYNLVYKNIK
jgi:polyisoprenoid-binding protein YceI